jgi:5-methylcytosine-specific restriction endonuclease McrA
MQPGCYRESGVKAPSHPDQGVKRSLPGLARGGTHRLSNLTLSCGPCNVKKGTQLIGDFLHRQPDVLARILAQAKTPLTAAAAVNATRWQL